MNDAEIENGDRSEETGGKISKKICSSKHPTTDCWYECALPKPPLPDPAHTLRRYLEYARVLADDGKLDLARTERCVREFGPMAEQLQAKLAKIAENSENWINDFWLPEMYLRQRLPLPLNFNPAYIFPRQHFNTVEDQLNYASWLVRGFLDFKERVDRKLVPRETIPDRFSDGNVVRMCMDQYERILNCYREPALGEDIQHDRRRTRQINGLCDIIGTESMAMNGKTDPLMPEAIINNRGYEPDPEEHIVVISDRQQFVLCTRPDSTALSAPEIAQQLAKIRGMSRNRARAGVHPVGGAGTGHRDRAAAFWEEMNKVSINRQSLEAIRSAVFVLCLDNNSENDAPDADSDHPPIKDNKSLINRLEQDGLQMIHGFGSERNGTNRWFDATIQLIVSRNGCCGLCIEHSVAEGIVIINMAESAMRFANEQWTAQKVKEGQKKATNSNIDQINGSVPITPKALSWALCENAIQLLREQIAEFDQLVRDAQLRVLIFEGFGKSAIKGWRISPDGFVQLALQLAHYRLHGYLVSSYESCTLRRFRYGRVDNIRAATPEALEWAKAMSDKKKGRETKMALLREAAKKQALITRENVTGHGIDNHICALEVLSRTAEKDDDVGRELFRDPAWHELMRFPLSTSQVSTSPEFVDCYLWYGPVVRDGYGCAYNIQQDKIIFAISVWKSDERTDADGFRNCLTEALKEMGALLENDT